MGADEIARTAGRLNAVANRWMAAPNTQERRFWFGLACAAALHAALIVGITRSLPRQMGEVSGRPDGISVELVEAADLLSKSTVPSQEDTPPTGPSKAAPQPRRQTAPATPPAAPVEEQKTTALPIEKASPKETLKEALKEALDALSPPDPSRKPSDPNAAAKSKPKPPPQAALPPQLNMPDVPTTFQGRGAAVARPAGITRSGENDDFGRGVIRALRQTMPGHRGIFGRVTIRLLLSETGNIVEVLLVRSGGDKELDQSVVFASKQSSFPIPPAGATLIDRTFLVTYIYN